MSRPASRGAVDTDGPATRTRAASRGASEVAAAEEALRAAADGIRLDEQVDTTNEPPALPDQPVDPSGLPAPAPASVAAPGESVEDEGLPEPPEVQRITDEMRLQAIRDSTPEAERAFALLNIGALIHIPRDEMVDFAVALQELLASFIAAPPPVWTAEQFHAQLAGQTGYNPATLVDVAAKQTAMDTAMSRIVEQHRGLINKLEEELQASKTTVKYMGEQLQLASGRHNSLEAFVMSLDGKVVTNASDTASLGKAVQDSISDVDKVVKGVRHDIAVLQSKSVPSTPGGAARPAASGANASSAPPASGGQQQPASDGAQKSGGAGASAAGNNTPPASNAAPATASGAQSGSSAANNAPAPAQSSPFPASPEIGLVVRAPKDVIVTSELDFISAIESVPGVSVAKAARMKKATSAVFIELTDPAHRDAFITALNAKRASFQAKPFEVRQPSTRQRQKAAPSQPQQAAAQAGTPTKSQRRRANRKAAAERRKAQESGSSAKVSSATPVTTGLPQQVISLPPQPHTSSSPNAYRAPVTHGMQNATMPVVSPAPAFNPYSMMQQMSYGAPVSGLPDAYYAADDGADVASDDGALAYAADADASHQQLDEPAPAHVALPGHVVLDSLPDGLRAGHRAADAAHSLRIATLNVCGLRSRVQGKLGAVLVKLQIDILAVTETHLGKKESVKVTGYTFFGCGGGRKESNGTGFLVRTGLPVTFYRQRSSPRASWLSFANTAGGVYYVGAIYAPTKSSRRDGGVAKRELFYRTCFADAVALSSGQMERVIFAGDFNAHLADVSDSGSDVLALREQMEHYCMRAVNLESFALGKWTYRKFGHELTDHSQIDYLMVHDSLLQSSSVTECVTLDTVKDPVESDHRIVSMTVSLGAIELTPPVTYRISEVRMAARHKDVDYMLSFVPRLQAALDVVVANVAAARQRPLTQSVINSIGAELANAYLDAAETSFQSYTVGKRGRPFWNADLSAACRRRDDAFRAFHDAVDFLKFAGPESSTAASVSLQNARVALTTARRIYRSMLNAAAHHYDAVKLTTMDDAMDAKNPRLFFRTLVRDQQRESQLPVVLRVVDSTGASSEVYSVADKLRVFNDYFRDLATPTVVPHSLEQAHVRSVLSDIERVSAGGAPTPLRPGEHDFDSPELDGPVAHPGRNRRLYAAEMKTAVGSDVFSRADDDELKQWLCSEVALEEVREVLKNIRSFSAPGRDGVLPEYVKPHYGNASAADDDAETDTDEWQLLAEKLTTVLNLFWEAGEIPAAWKDGNLIPVYKKKGDPSDCSNYRGLTMTSVLGKVFEGVLLARLEKICSKLNLLEPGMFGFVKKRGCPEAAVVLSELMERARERGTPLIAAFLDIVKAYDTVPHDVLMAKLWNLGIRGQMWRVINSWYKGLKSRVVAAGMEATDVFDVLLGLRQGSALSPILYNLFLSGFGDFVMGQLRPEEVYSIGELQLGVFFYADDIWLLAKDFYSMFVMLSGAQEFAAMARFKFSAAKSQVMFINHRQIRGFSLHGQPLEIVESVVHLGYVHHAVSLEASWDASAQRLAYAARGKAHQILDMGMRNGYLTVARGQILECAYVDSIADYGAQVWEPGRGVAARIESIFAQIYRSMTGARRLSNAAALCLELGRTWRRGRRDYLKLVFYGKMARLPEDDLVKRVLRIRLADHVMHMMPGAPKIIWSRPYHRGFMAHVRVALHSIGMEDLWQSLDFSIPEVWKHRAKAAIHEREFAALRAHLTGKPSRCLPDQFQFLVRDDKLARQFYLQFGDHFVRGFLADMRLGTSELFAHARRQDFGSDLTKYDHCPVCRLRLPESVAHFLFSCAPLYGRTRPMWREASQIANSVGQWIAREFFPGGAPNFPPGRQQLLVNLFLGCNRVVGKPTFGFRDINAVQLVLWSHVKALFFERERLIRDPAAVSAFMRAQIPYLLRSRN